MTYNDVTEIDQHPFATVFAFRRDDLAAGFLDLFLNVLGQRFDLTIRIAGRDDNSIEHRRQFAGVDDFDILALDVFEGGNDNFCSLRMSIRYFYRVGEDQYSRERCLAANSVQTSHWPIVCGFASPKWPAGSWQK